MRFLNKFALFFFFILLLNSSFAQKKGATANKAPKGVVASIGKENISSNEFETAFKQVGIAKKEGKIDSLAEKKNFLNLYVDYKLKLLEAENRGYENDPSVIKECDDYANSLASKMLVEREITDKGIERLYERRKTEIRLSQIFIKNDSTKSDLGLSKANEIFEKLKKGASFESLVKEYSDDVNSKDKGGDLYFVTAGDISIPEIEDAIYNTEPGNVCPVVFKTQFGFHILKVTAKQDRKYGVMASHILAAYTTDAKTPPDTAKAKKKILEAQEALKKGMRFSDVVIKYSDDQSTLARAGNIGTVTRGRFLREFEDKVMSMKENETSDIVQTPYGFHIIKVDKILPYPPLDKQKEELKQIYDRSGYQNDMRNYVAGLKDELKYELNDALYKKLAGIKDSCVVGDSVFNAEVVDKFKDSLFAKIEGKPYIADSLFNYMLNSNEIFGRKYNPATLQMGTDRYFTIKLLAEKGKKMYAGDPEFIKQMRDYKNGVLLFKINEKEIWSRVKVDSVQMKNYWFKTKDKYFTKPKYTYKVIFLSNDDKVGEVWTALKKGATFDEMLKKSDRPDPEKQITQSADESRLAKKASTISKIGEYAEPFSFEGGWAIVRLEGKVDPRLKTYDEAKGEVASILQDKENKKLEEALIKKLTAKYKPIIYTDNI